MTADRPYIKISHQEQNLNQGKPTVQGTSTYVVEKSIDEVDSAM
jgi:hypothetical protein